MKKLVMTTLLLISGIANAKSLYAVKSIDYDVTRAQKAGDVLFCGNLDNERSVVSGCVNLNLMEDYTVHAANDGAVILTEKATQIAIPVGKIVGGNFILDDMDKGYLTRAESNGRLRVNVLVRNSVVFNDSFGCSSLTDCNWNVLRQKRNLSLEVRIDGRRLEKINLN
ncbi:hypothetical protein EZJ49_15140 [Bdellovibrio bacteriovorus]|uniref:hypothetical protein n=1 Tax=Bdellovibrio bacteriovorus TaxID=959 RepID=UPI0021D061F2|nr:hypothetical protein [Bdellovibrio bacteriovorus]UXR64403.1 hypothetical protein EZJ49_15140 [Bdellovibrio bacteriovorus]